MLKFRFFCRESKGSVAVEFALISTFFLFPLFSGVTDCVEIISAQAQLNTAVQALFYNAWTNPTTAIAPTSTTAASGSTSTATEMQTVLNVIRASSMTNMTLGSVDGTETKDCVMPSTSVTSAYPATGGCAAPLVEQDWVAYQVNATVDLTFPFPGLPRAMPLTATGKVEVQ